MKSDDAATAEWLKENGAKSPMCVAGIIHLVLGEFQKNEGSETGTYPVSYYKPMFGSRHDPPEEKWYHYMEKLPTAPTKQQCLAWVQEQKLKKI